MHTTATFDASGHCTDATGTQLAVSSAIANVNASQTDSVLVAAVTGSSIRVLAVFSQCGGTATNLTFNSKGSGAGTAISPVLANGANLPSEMGYNPHGWFQTNSGEALTCSTGSGSATGIVVVYATVPTTAV